MYFRLLRQGQDEPLARMGQDGVTHDLSDSKGVWVYHMLRQIVGDERGGGQAEQQPGPRRVHEKRRAGHAP